jgi:hypothetical protein
MSEPLPPLPITAADPKPWYASAGVLGALVVILAQIAAAFGWAIDVPALTGYLTDAVTLAGGAVALWGRIRAEQPIAPLISGPK